MLPSTKVFNYKRLILLLAVLLAILAYPFLFDDAIDDDISALVIKFNNQTTVKNNGSVYQLGMWAKSTTSPYEVGLWRLNQYDKALKRNNGSATNLTFEDRPKDSWIRKINFVEGTQDLLCDFSQIQCLDSLYEASQEKNEKIAALLQVNTANIEIYDGQMQYDKFQLYANPSLTLPQIQFGLGLDINKLKLMSIIQSVASSNGDAVTSELKQMLNFHQKVLAQTPYAITKIKSVIQYVSILDTVAFLIGKTDKSKRTQWAEIIRAFSFLQKDQLNMNKITKLRIVSAANGWAYFSIENMSASLPDSESRLPFFILFKPNRTLNSMYQHLLQDMDYSELSKGRIINTKPDNLKQAIGIDYTNFIGSTLLRTAVPKTIDLTPDLLDLEVRQRMITYLYDKSSHQESIFRSPHTGESAFYQKAQFCVSTNNPKRDVCITAF